MNLHTMVVRSWNPLISLIRVTVINVDELAKCHELLRVNHCFISPPLITNAASTILVWIGGK